MSVFDPNAAFMNCQLHEGTGSSKGSSKTREGQAPDQAPSSYSASSASASSASASSDSDSSDSANEGAAENPQTYVAEATSESPEQAESESSNVKAQEATGHSDQNAESAPSSTSETHTDADDDDQSVTQSASESAASKRSESAADSGPGTELYPAAHSKPAEDATGSHAPEPHALNDASPVRPSPPSTAEKDRDDVEQSEPAGESAQLGHSSSHAEGSYAHSVMM